MTLPTVTPNPIPALSEQSASIPLGTSSETPEQLANDSSAEEFIAVKGPQKDRAIGWIRKLSELGFAKPK